MTRRQLLIILIALAIVGTAGLILVKRGKETWAVREAKAGDKVLPDFRYNDVAAIRIKGATEFNIVQHEGVWRVPERNNYPANYQQIRNLLFKIREIKVVQSEHVGPSQLPRVELAASVEAADVRRRNGDERENPPPHVVGYDPANSGRHQGTLIEFKDDQGKLLDSLLLGKMHLRHEEGSVPRGLHGLFDGRYILRPADPENVLLISDDLAIAAPEPGAWLSREFFKIENVQSVSLLSSEPGHSWSISRDDESRPWELMDRKPDGSEVLDASVASEIAEMFRFLTFADVVPKGAPSDIKKPTALTVMTFDHFAYTLKIGARGENGNYSLAISVSADESKTGENRMLREKLAREKTLAQWVYIVEPQIIEVLHRDRARLLEKKSLAGAN